MYIASWVNSPFQGSGWNRINRPTGPPTIAERGLQNIFRLGEALISEFIGTTVGEINPFAGAYLTEKFQESAEQFINNDLIRIHREFKPFARANEWGPQLWFNQFIDYLIDTPTN